MKEHFKKDKLKMRLLLELSLINIYELKFNVRTFLLICGRGKKQLTLSLHDYGYIKDN